MLVPFKGRKLKRAGVVWLNKRWFLERGLNVDEPSTRSRVDAWLLSEFAFVANTDRERENDALDMAAACTLYSDRYGSTGGMSPHGGSGRVATVGRFQVKGVGITPLVGITRQMGHAHGCLSLAEALREAILAEIAGCEFPHGSVPTIAVIATGERFTSPDASERFDQNVSRALSVRPAVVRLAHAERAPCFRMSATGYKNSKNDDAHRTKDVVISWQTTKKIPSKPTHMLPLTELVANVAQQAAFGQAHRFFSGGFFSSNITSSGELLDFGNAHVLPNWSTALVLPHAPGFGSEMKGVVAIIWSLSFFFQKYGSDDSGNTSLRALLAIAKESYERQMKVEWARIWGCDECDNEWVSDMMSQHFRLEQRTTSLYQFGEAISFGRGPRPDGNLYEILAKECSRKQGRNVDRAAQSSKNSRDLVNEMLSRLGSCQISAALRYLKPRTSVDRGVLLRQLHNLFESGGVLTERSVADEYFGKAVDLSRRHWRRLPRGLCVQAHVYRDGSSALECRDASGQSCLWIEGPTHSDSYWLFGECLSSRDLADIDVEVDRRSWSACIVVKRHYGASNRRHDLRFGSKRVQIPSMTVTYTPH
jgi:hypothetical protein